MDNLYDTIEEFETLISRLTYQFTTNEALVTALLKDVYCKDTESNPIIDGMIISNKLILGDINRISDKLTVLMRSEKYKNNLSS